MARLIVRRPDGTPVGRNGRRAVLDRLADALGVPRGPDATDYLELKRAKGVPNISHVHVTVEERKP